MTSVEEGRPQASSPRAHPSDSESFVPQAVREQVYREFAELDAQEKAIIRKRAELKQLLNSFLPIDKLPTELLVQIFSDFHDVPTKQTKHGLRQRVYQRMSICTDWVRLMLVCHRWRDTLVSTPTFWRRIDSGYRTKWIRLCLRRSAPTSIDVVARFRDRRRLDLLCTHAHRLRTLVVFWKESTALPPLFGSGMPLLESLDFIGNGKVNHLNIHLTSQRYPWLHALTLSSMPGLQDISLYAQLRTLELKDCRYKSFKGFIDALSASVQLEALIIRRLQLPDSDVSSEEWMHNPGPILRRAPTVLLPRLRTLSLTGNSIADTSRLLAYLYLHPSAEVEISADAPDPVHTVPGDDSDTTLCFSAMLPPDPFAVLPSLTMATKVFMTIQDPDRFFELRYEYPSPVGAGSDPDTRVTLSLETRFIQLDPFMCTALHDLAQCFQHSPLTYLHVDGKYAYGTVASWAGVFRAFPLLERLDIRNGPGQVPSQSAVTLVFRGLHVASTPTSAGPQACSSGESSACAVACANLQNVVVQGVAERETYEALRECFRWRGERGIILKVLNLMNVRDWPGDATTADAHRTLAESLRGAVETLHM